jgi:hypothetical protein
MVIIQKPTFRFQDLMHDGLFREIVTVFGFFVRGQSFMAVSGVIRQIFGAPKVSVESDANGHPHQVYGSPDLGLAVQCIGRTDDVEIDCVKGTAMWWH